MGKTLTVSEKPAIFPEGAFNKEILEKFKDKIWKVSDIYRQQLDELFEILHPNPNEKNKLQTFLKDRTEPDSEQKGTWVYFPWNQLLIHLLNDSDYYQVRTNRNREIITTKEQEKIKSFKIGVAGLSIGANIALNLAHLGARNLKIADFDTLATSNLNRVPAGLPEIGQNKAKITAGALYEIDPYINLEVIESGLKSDILSDFLAGKKKLNLVIDALDDFEIKIRLRLLAKKEKIPVLMVTNLGDSCLVDVERYDKDPNLEIFNGLLGTISQEILESKMSEEDKKKFAAKIVGVDHIPSRALESLLSIGQTLVGRPQLASTVSIGAGIAAYIVRKIALYDDWPSRRQLLHFDSAFLESKDASKLYQEEPNRAQIIKKLKV